MAQTYRFESRLTNPTVAGHPRATIVAQAQSNPRLGPIRIGRAQLDEAYLKRLRVYCDRGGIEYKTRLGHPDDPDVWFPLDSEAHEPGDPEARCLCRPGPDGRMRPVAIQPPTAVLPTSASTLPTSASTPPPSAPSPLPVRKANERRP